MADENREPILCGLDEPKTILCWTLLEIVYAISIIFVGMMLDNILTGAVFAISLLYWIHKKRDGEKVNGISQHFFWKISAVVPKEFKRSPDAAVTRFDS